MRICWCEQSGEIEDRSALQLALRRCGFDYYRLNWRHGASDTFANVTTEGRASWSVGRSRLYEAASANGYDYYVFADDDIVFGSEPVRALRRAREVLSLARPWTACLASPNWHDARRPPRSLRPSRFPYFMADLEAQIMSSFVAQLTFPVAFDGGWGTLWYPNVGVFVAAPGAQLQLDEIQIRNARSDAAGFYGGVEHQQLGPTIKRATFNETLPSWLLSQLRKRGLKPAATRINAMLVYARLESFGPRSRDRLRAYIDEVRRLAALVA